ncbi:hypothetical protein AVEN_218817-1, partial [Araneus ventricosus]
MMVSSSGPIDDDWSHPFKRGVVVACATHNEDDYAFSRSTYANCRGRLSCSEHPRL